MLNNTVFRLNNFTVRAPMRFLRFLSHRFIRNFILIHTPKCAGTYLIRQYNLHQSIRIKSVGHANFRTLKIYPKTEIVGLIREPTDWYASYYYFCKKALLKAPQSISNFPIQHPISVFSENAKISLEQMISNMANREFLEDILATGMTANVYAKTINDVFDFMKRTESGFWSWTMMYHFSKKDTIEIKTKKDVISEAKKIATYVKFIHQENIGVGIENLLNLRHKTGARLNVSQPLSGQKTDQTMKHVVKKLDGEAAYILGEYFS